MEAVQVVPPLPCLCCGLLGQTVQFGKYRHWGPIWWEDSGASGDEADSEVLVELSWPVGMAVCRYESETQVAEVRTKLFRAYAEQRLLNGYDFRSTECNAVAGHYCVAAGWDVVFLSRPEEQRLTVGGVCRLFEVSGVSTALWALSLPSYIGTVPQEWYKEREPVLRTARSSVLGGVFRPAL